MALMIDSVENENIVAEEINLTLPFIILKNGDHPQRFLKYVRPFFNIINKSVKAKKKKKKKNRHCPSMKMYLILL